jgi:1-aminocyclopropane-1-carboxylate deaminase
VHKLKLNLPSPIEKVKGHGLPLDLYVKREDLIHPLIKGNKYRKLKYNLPDMQSAGCAISFGGPYSNHIHALAALCQSYDIKSVGIIRGEEVDNEVLNFCKSCGMKLHFVDREAYRKKMNAPSINQIIASYENALVIPEGGSNDLALKGVSELVDEIVASGQTYDYIAVAAGTGCTAAGILKGIQQHELNTKLVVFSALKGDWMANEISRFARMATSTFFCTDKYSMGGYAKTNDDFKKFVRDFIISSNIEVDMIYNGKLIYGLNDMAIQNYFQDGAKILWVNSGGVTAKL